MPRPPPPAAALMSTGKPISWAIRRATFSSSTAPSLPGTTGTFAFLASFVRATLSPTAAIALTRRADELDLAAAADLGEVGVLGEEAVAGMNRLHVGDLGGGDDARDVEIGLGRRGGADADRLVGQLQIRRVLVGGGIDDGRLDAQLAAGADDPQGDLAAVGDEDLGEHCFGSVRSE